MLWWWLAVIVSKIVRHYDENVSDVDELRRRLNNEWIVWIKLFIERAVGDVEPASIHAITFALEAGIKISSI